MAAIAFLVLTVAAGARAAPSALIDSLQTEFGWSTAQISLAITVNLLCYGLTAPFVAALIQRFGIRRITFAALALVGAGSGLSVLSVRPWMLVVTWGLLIGLGTGAVALVFAAAVVDTWFARRRGLVMGILTAGQSTGQLVFLPVVANLTESVGWRWATLVLAATALVLLSAVRWLRGDPEQLAVVPFGAPPGWHTPPRPRGNPAAAALHTLRIASRSKTFWSLMAGFAICGATTNGIVGTHFIPSAHDHGMPQTTAAGLLAVVGIFDVLGTIGSGWLTDRLDPRVLLGIYYAGRGVGLAALPFLLGASVQPPMILFIIVYGLDWVATVPPTVALCNEAFGDRGPIVFGWAFASHQVGAAIAALAAGVVRDVTGQYTFAWFAAAALCGVAVVISFAIRRGPVADIER
ncbi:MFS transporter [Raineyella sp. W15-4]|uniref:MFS transporter n=1 Tax=Raineyella sp. W15-4 TaxID=3081651 RepID=UPI0029545754|nr:MFS transporter [Raineyella sp. W15-4]WOQ15602.1 MFS transporter [Raineyella sp. W15-4]